MTLTVEVLKKGFYFVETVAQKIWVLLVTSDGKKDVLIYILPPFDEIFCKLMY